MNDLLFFEEEPWRKGAACLPCTDINVFFPEGRGTGPSHYAEARSYCSRCPVRAECLEYAVRTGQEFGMFGGATPTDRKRARRCSTSKAKAV